MILVWAGLCAGSVLAAPDTEYALYSASSALDGKPVTLKLNTFSGDSWFFDGRQWQPMAESGNKNFYDMPSYQLKLTDSAQGLVIFRFSVVNGSTWVYTSGGWEFIDEPER